VDEKVNPKPIDAFDKVVQLKHEKKPEDAVDKVEQLKHEKKTEKSDTSCQKVTSGDNLCDVTIGRYLKNYCLKKEESIKRWFCDEVVKRRDAFNAIVSSKSSPFVVELLIPEEYSADYQQKILEKYAREQELNIRFTKKHPGRCKCYNLYIDQDEPMPRPCTLVCLISIALKD
jgi:hypothetical protein